MSKIQSMTFSLCAKISFSGNRKCVPFNLFQNDPRVNFFYIRTWFYCAKGCLSMRTVTLHWWFLHEHNARSENEFRKVPNPRIILSLRNLWFISALDDFSSEEIDCSQQSTSPLNRQTTTLVPSEATSPHPTLPYERSTTLVPSEATSPHPTLPYPCSGFWCANTSLCYANYKVCNGHRDCPDGTDEDTTRCGLAVQNTTQSTGLNPSETAGLSVGIILLAATVLAVVFLAKRVLARRRAKMMSNNTYMNFKELDDITGIENQVYTLDQVWATSNR